MLIAIDIGNTNVVAAVFDEDRIVKVYRIATDCKRTGDEYSAIFLSFFMHGTMDIKKIDRVALSSVVPALVEPFVYVSKNVFGVEPFIVKSKELLNGALPIRLPDSVPCEMGNDLVCDALGAWKLFGRANIVVDFGTALTFTATDSNGVIRGVDIAPGLITAVNSLASATAQLPQVFLAAPPSVLATNTVEAIQGGIVLGYKGLVEGLVKSIKDELHKKFGENRDDIAVVATGGLSSVLESITDVFNVVDKELTLKGLKSAFEYGR